MAKPESLESDSSSARYLGYVIGGFVAAGVIFTLLRMLMPLLRLLMPVLIGWWVWRRWHKVQQSQRDKLNEVFYELLQEHQGQITVLDFAMTAKVSAIAARNYLDTRAKEFAAHFEVTERGDVFYLFPTLKAPYFQSTGQLFTDQSVETPAKEKSLKGREPLQAPSEKLSQPPDTCHSLTVGEPLTQAQLARRLNVSAGVISRKKLSPDLAEWSKAHDPDGVGWAYLTQTRRFLPIDADQQAI
ncbi:hypothetical protein [Leptothermofonsia sp. ETS-13]|uniref:hypothetical protein n=1 Tax=Leptothermofonsia sp. ETS-13 TaxID=3035696 RepID=UPI003B9F88CF